MSSRPLAARVERLRLGRRSASIGAPVLGALSLGSAPSPTESACALVQPRLAKPRGPRKRQRVGEQRVARNSGSVHSVAEVVFGAYVLDALGMCAVDTLLAALKAGDALCKSDLVLQWPGLGRLVLEYDGGYWHSLPRRPDSAFTDI